MSWGEVSSTKIQEIKKEIQEVVLVVLVVLFMKQSSDFRLRSLLVCSSFESS